MATAAPTDQRVLMKLDWAGYEMLDASRGDKSTPRITYLDGVAELMSPSTEHEGVAHKIGRLIETWCIARGIELNGYKSWTVRKQDANAGAEADECYIFGAEMKSRPDLAIEVVWTSGGIDKLEVWRRLHVPEVWFWEDNAITVFALRDADYVQVDRSPQLPELDLVALEALIHTRTLNEAVLKMQALARTP